MALIGDWLIRYLAHARLQELTTCIYVACPSLPPFSGNCKLLHMGLKNLPPHPTPRLNPTHPGRPIKRRQMSVMATKAVEAGPEKDTEGPSSSLQLVDTVKFAEEKYRRRPGNGVASRELVCQRDLCRALLVNSNSRILVA